MSHILFACFFLNVWPIMNIERDIEVPTLRIHCTCRSYTESLNLDNFTRNMYNSYNYCIILYTYFAYAVSGRQAAASALTQFSWAHHQGFDSPAQPRRWTAWLPMIALPSSRGLGGQGHSVWWSQHWAAMFVQGSDDWGNVMPRCPFWFVRLGEHWAAYKLWDSALSNAMSCKLC